MTIEQLYELYKTNPSVQTDTRKLKEGDIYFALKGPNFNGNSFAGQALGKGASYAVIDEKEYARDDRMIVVNDSLNTLQQLAKYHRLQFDSGAGGRQVPFIAVTGSNGKTTTKELIHSVLSTAYKTYTTQGNLNNHIGIPLTLLSIKNDAEMVVIEMGANHQKEIENYCKYVLPTHGIITNCGKAHLEGFGGIEGVQKAKGELFDFLRDNHGTAFIMNDYEYLRRMSKGISKIITYGTEEADVVGKLSQTEPFLSLFIEKGADLDSLQTKLVGDYNLPNILAAVTIGKFFRVEEENIKMAIETYQPSNSRSQLIEKNGNKIILDAYNANPSSMKVAIENFARMNADNKILLLGAMAELGETSLQEHEELIRLISQYAWKEVIFVGGDFLKTRNNFKKFNNSVEAGQWLKEQQFHETYMLIKGSRSMQMEKVIE
ncbi:MAG: UDP-N-acetylmuramoyl-tripeptide--D-alanyl-D-alanine ligase [Chitinophagaceae bacterium]|nr:UDP-N-acetylmuramoyl-tripeptide--D-alanyl-D-alanine ligase [Chitinophagaceae bacterium]